MKKVIVIIIFLCIILVGVCFGIRYTNNNEISEGYIAVFCGGTGERVYSTYVYKIDNGQANYGFKYINTVSTTISLESTELNEKITGRGKLDWTDDVFYIAKKNDAYDYVRIPNSTKTYTIEEFMTMFIMN